jgi:hypothetical protein
MSVQLLFTMNELVVFFKEEEVLKIRYLHVTMMSTETATMAFTSSELSIVLEIR